jgi:hypothetical protein
MLLRLIVGYGRRIEPALRDQLLRGLVEVVCAGTGSQALSHFGGEGQDRGERPVVDGDVGSDPARLCGARQPVPPAPGAVAGAARPQPVAGSSPRTTQPRCTGVTYSAVCSTSTDELHERTYAHPRALGITLPAGSGLKRGLALVGWWRYRGGVVSIDWRGSSRSRRPATRTAARQGQRRRRVPRWKCRCRNRSCRCAQQSRTCPRFA